jgi:uncharacterized protein YjeT (DUF2065 family)
VIPIDWQDFLAACALYLVFEGLLPTLSPSRFRDSVSRLAELDDRTLRGIGLASMVAGALLLSFVRA